jgi:hypothetical protein
MVLALSRTQQLPREVTHSISRRASPMTYGRFRSILSETSGIFKAGVTVKLHRLLEAGHLPVAPVIARQAMRVMGPVTRRTQMPKSTEERKGDL